MWCPACQSAIALPLDKPSGPNWGFNGDTEKPTFTPSVLRTYRHPTGYSNKNPAPIGYDGPYTDDICHSFITDGKIQFLGDCTHALAGQTVELPGLPEWLANEKV